MTYEHIVVPPVDYSAMISKKNEQPIKLKNLFSQKKKQTKNCAHREHLDIYTSNRQKKAKIK